MKKELVLGIIALFIVSAVSPMVFGYNFNISDVKEQKPINSSYSNPPEEEWNKTFGGIYDDIGTSVQQTGDGGYIITGETYSYGAGDGDFWLIKTDANGIMQWNKTFGGYEEDMGWSVQQTNDEGYIIAGVTDSYGAGSTDVWLIKTDANGTMQWNNTFGGPSYDRCWSVQQTNDEGYIMVGYTYPSIPSVSDVWLIKTDPNGTMQWNNTFGGGLGDGGHAVQQTYDEGYIIVGTTYSFGPGWADVWLIKTDTNGTMQWNNTFGGPETDYCKSVQQTDDGGYIIVGSTESYGAGNYDIWLIKTDANGIMQWNKTFGGTGDEWGQSVQQTTDNGYIITGETWSYAAGYGDVWMIKTDANGIMQWNKTFGGYEEDCGWTVQQTDDEGYIISGITYSFGAGWADFWLIKVEGENHPPDAPIITGPNSGKPGIEYTYTAATSDFDCDNISYFFTWGDFSNSGWTEFVPSGTPVNRSHSWMFKGTYTINVKAKDVLGEESDWGYLEVTMPMNQNQQIHNTWWFLQFLQNHPRMFPILRQLLGL